MTSLLSLFLQVETRFYRLIFSVKAFYKNCLDHMFECQVMYLYTCIVYVR